MSYILYVYTKYIIYVSLSNVVKLLSVIVLLVHFKADEPFTEIFGRLRVPVPFYRRSANDP